MVMRPRGSRQGRSRRRPLPKLGGRSQKSMCATSTPVASRSLPSPTDPRSVRTHDGDARNHSGDARLVKRLVKRRPCASVRWASLLAARARASATHTLATVS